MDVLVLERTRSGLPALWEKGGGRSNTGSAVIVAGPAGKKKRPVNIRRWGHLAGVSTPSSRSFWRRGGLGGLKPPGKGGR